ncbi:hypothetical protein [Oceaniglobus indicus]|nr:hypothetical protein [Oceaniglobus indicus]
MGDKNPKKKMKQPSKPDARMTAPVEAAPKVVEAKKKAPRK